MLMAVQFDAERAVVHADLFEQASFDEEMNILYTVASETAGIRLLTRA